MKYRSMGCILLLSLRRTKTFPPAAKPRALVVSFGTAEAAP